MQSLRPSDGTLSPRPAADTDPTNSRRLSAAYGVPSATHRPSTDGVPANFSRPSADADPASTSQTAQLFGDPDTLDTLREHAIGALADGSPTDSPRVHHANPLTPCPSAAADPANSPQLFEGPETLDTLTEHAIDALADGTPTDSPRVHHANRAGVSAPHSSCVMDYTQDDAVPANSPRPSSDAVPSGTAQSGEPFEEPVNPDGLTEHAIDALGMPRVSPLDDGTPTDSPRQAGAG